MIHDTHSFLATSVFPKSLVCNIKAHGSVPGGECARQLPCRQVLPRDIVDRIWHWICSYTEVANSRLKTPQKVGTIWGFGELSPFCLWRSEFEMRKWLQRQERSKIAVLNHGKKGERGHIQRIFDWCLLHKTSNLKPYHFICAPCMCLKSEFRTGFSIF